MHFIRDHVFLYTFMVSGSVKKHMVSDESITENTKQYPWILDFRQVSQNSVTFLCNHLGWSYPVASSGKTHQVGSLNFIHKGSGMSDTPAMARHFLQDYLKMKCCEQEALILNSVFGSLMDMASLLWPSTKLSPLTNWSCCMLERSALSFIVELIYWSMPKCFEAADVRLLMCSNYCCISSTLYQLSTK